MSQTNQPGSIDPGKLEFHPAANIFPLLEGAELEALVEDIRINGLQTPILLHPDGRVLDGRNRLRACLKAGVEPRFEYCDGQASPIDLTISLNLRRRHLNESQRALAAARLKEQLGQEAAFRRGARTDMLANLPASQFGYARDQAAGLLNVSGRLVQDAARVLRSGDAELILAIESGRMTVSMAARRLRTPRAETSPESAEASSPMRRVCYADPATAGPLPKLPVGAMAAGDGMLMLWGPLLALTEVLHTLERSGFRCEKSPAG